MGTCETCGNETQNLIFVKISGSTMKVCNTCKQLGIIIDKKNNTLSHSFRKKNKNYKTSLGVISNYISIVNSTLAKKGFDFHKLAKGTNIKESSLTKYLSGKIKLDVETAKKIERFLEIKLVEEVENTTSSNFFETEDDTSQSISLGDLLKKQLDK